MAALREFDRRGGLIGMGDDAGFIYQMYGFGLIRGMELHQEAGFHPLKIIQQATGNNAKILGQEEKLGRVRAGFAADLIVVNGQSAGESEGALPQRRSKRSATASRCTPAASSGPSRTASPITLPTLMARVKEMVAQARKK